MHKTVENILSKLNKLIFWARLYVKRATLKYGALYILLKKSAPKWSEITPNGTSLPHNGDSDVPCSRKTYPARRKSTKIDRNDKNYIFLCQNLRDWTAKYTSLRVSDKRRDSGSTVGCAWDCSCVFSFGVISDRIRLNSQIALFREGK